MVKQVDAVQSRVNKHSREMQRALRQMLKSPFVPDLDATSSTKRTLNKAASKSRNDQRHVASHQYMISLQLAQEASEKLHALKQQFIPHAAVACVKGWKSSPSCDTIPIPRTGKRNRAHPNDDESDDRMDLPCDTVVASDRSGYCDCRVVLPNGTVHGDPLPIDPVPCLHEPFTCNQFCSQVWSGEFVASSARDERSKMLYRDVTEADKEQAYLNSQVEFSLRHLRAVDEVRRGRPNPDPEALKLVSDALREDRIAAFDAYLAHVYEQQTTTARPTTQAVTLPPVMTSTTAPLPVPSTSDASTNATVLASNVSKMITSKATIDAATSDSNTTREEARTEVNSPTTAIRNATTRKNDTQTNITTS